MRAVLNLIRDYHHTNSLKHIYRVRAVKIPVLLLLSGIATAACYVLVNGAAAKPSAPPVITRGKVSVCGPAQSFNKNGR
ncbi:hypothetical protein [Mucilaginibacter phyllosphaerae]|uniref:Uncharacterized protein n=1 Tax=Mucilaginibacter phyllosphaerae TaxID=1812349 RepID=A0A4Y8AAZ3_9SPHI|nr:hypothetical protein [Mucilaginibacter phyllosphaerae]TEW65734.1 hypothetical protein E2R65_11355 [Mucilaginibacter phyllosphaerae]